jgi:heat shock protein HtpX
MKFNALGSSLRTVAVFTFVFVFMWALAAGLSLFLPVWGMTWFLLWSAIALLVNLFTYFASDRIVLWSYRVRLVEPAEAPDLHAVVEEVAAAAGVPKPRVGIMEESSPNAFATGRNPRHAVVACTTGLLRLMDREELKGVLAHEIGHVRNRDTLVMTATATIAAFFAYAIQFAGQAAASRGRAGGSGLATGLLAYIGGMIAATLIRAFVSRSREFKADATGARLAGGSRGLQSALLKLDDATRGVPMKTAKEASAHMFIVNPLTGQHVYSLFRSHPPMEKRIERLRELGI